MFQKNRFISSERFFVIIVITVLAFGWLFLFWPMLASKLLFSPRFIGLYYYMYFDAIKHFVFDLGSLANWWPAYNSGYPINLTLDGFLNPIFIFTLKFLSPFFANNLLILFFFTVNGLSLYLFARSINISKISSLIASIAYAFSGVIMRFQAVTTIAAVMPFLPLSFLFCLKIFQGGTKKWFLGWLALLVYSWIGGWSEIIVYALTAATFFAFYLAVKRKGSGEFSFKPMVLFFGTVVLSVVILAPWFLSVMYFVSFSERARGVNLESASYMPLAASRLLHMVHPRLSIFYGELLPYVPIIGEDVFLYIGPLPLLLALLSLFIKNKRRAGHLLFFLFLALGSILMTISNSPLFWLFHKLPVLKWFGGYWKWSFVIVFSLSVLSGYGMDNIQDFFRNRFSKRVLLVLWSVLVIAFAGAFLVKTFSKDVKSNIASFGLSRYKNTRERVFSRSQDYYAGIIEKMADGIVESFSLGNKWTAYVLLMWFLVLIYTTAYKAAGAESQKFKILAVLIAFSGSVFIWRGYFDGPPVSYLKNYPDTAQYLHSINKYASSLLPLDKKKARDLEPYRILIYLPDQYVAEISQRYGAHLAEKEVRLWFSREMMDDNLHIGYDFDTFVNHQTLSLQRLADMYYLTRRQEPFTNKSLLKTTAFSEYLDSFAQETNLKLLGMLNIKYILSPFELKGDLNKIFTSYTQEEKIPIRIYENPYFMPRWYFADGVKWSDSENSSAMENLKSMEDFRKTTLIEELNSNDRAIVTAPNQQDAFNVELYSIGKLIVKTNTKNYRFFVFSESRMPFWQARINGKIAPLYTANYLYQAVLVPPGENEIEFSYPNLWQQTALSSQYFFTKITNKFLQF